MKTTIAIVICKLLTFMCKIMGKLIGHDGTVYPGSIALKFDKFVLDKIIYPKYVIAVTGSTGKGSTTSMIAHILKSSGKVILWNENGSNVKNGTASLILSHSGIFSHKLKTDILLLEMDEQYLAQTFKKSVITHLCITNIMRDQPARNIHPQVIYDKIVSAVKEDTHIILNVDDPLLNRIRYAFDNKITTYGIAKNKYDLESAPNYAIDFAYCPSCQSKIEYEAYHYGNLGVYKCPTCSFKRSDPDYEASEIDLKNKTFKIGKDYLKLNRNALFAVYYTTLAYAICDIIGVQKEDILKNINDNMMESQTIKEYKLNNRNFEILDVKNETALSFVQALSYIKNQSGKKTVVMGVEKVSRRYIYNDLSWLWDINFETLNDNTIDKIYLIGLFKYDIAVRLDYALIDPNKIVFVDDVNNLMNEIKESSEGDIYALLYYDLKPTIKGLLKEEDNEKNN